MPITTERPPLKTAFAVPLRPEDQGRVPPMSISKPWVRWLTRGLVAGLDKAAKREDTVALTGQTASIGQTAFSLGTIPPGLYRATVYGRVTQAATTSSSLTVTIHWTDGVAQSVALGPEAGNAVTSVLQGAVILNADAATPVLYSTTYASVGATAMQYRLTVSVEALSLD